jgi:uncharacterized protein YjbI with pentapeptide repeats
MINSLNITLKYLFSFIVKLLGIYIILFVMCFYAHVNESNIIADRAGALWDEVEREGPSRLTQVVSIQQMVRKVKPNLFSPYTVFKSLLGERESFKLVNIQLMHLVDNNKNKLAGTNLSHSDFTNINFSKADMHRANLFKANFSGADLSGADLSGANLRGANLTRANFSGADLSGANFEPVRITPAKPKFVTPYLDVKLYQVNLTGAVLRGASLKTVNLYYVRGLACEQLKLAMIDKKTIFPKNILWTWFLDGTFLCAHLNEN